MAYYKIGDRVRAGTMFKHNKLGTVIKVFPYIRQGNAICSVRWDDGTEARAIDVYALERVVEEEDCDGN